VRAHTAKRPVERLQAEEDEVGRAEELERGEGGLRSDEKRRDARAGRQRPDELSRNDPERGEDTARSTTRQGVANRQSRVGTGRDDDEDGDAEESGELGQERLTIASASSRVKARRVSVVTCPCFAISISTW
jgi:hypothetical protein